MVDLCYIALVPVVCSSNLLSIASIIAELLTEMWTALAAKSRLSSRGRLRS